MIDELLEHVGLAHCPDPDLAGLRVAHRAFLDALAYDGLTAQLGEWEPLDPDALVARTLATGRGGYCFEMNTMLLALLEGLGFVVERREGLVDARDAHTRGALTNHMALVTTLDDGSRWLCDAGLGEGFLEPVALADGVKHEQGALSWTVAREGDGWWVAQHQWGSFPGFRFGDAAVPLDAFAPHHERLATAPESSFVQTLAVQRPLADHILTLRARTLSRVGPDRDERAVLTSDDAFATTLLEDFGIDPAALGAERVARLWARAGDQHEAWLARRACSPASAPPPPPPPA